MVSFFLFSLQCILGSVVLVGTGTHVDVRGQQHDVIPNYQVKTKKDSDFKTFLSD